MIDREKVIAGITMLVDRKNDDTCEGLKCCKIAEDALALLKDDETQLQYRDDHIAMYQAEIKRLEALLKEQVPVKPTWSLGKPFCGACGLRIRSGKYCSECGKPILWEGR
jgi:uncharacterized small protein (DUF1192 family)